MSHRTHLVLFAILAACDPSARTESRGSAPPTEERRSRELETCSRSSDCAADLRCFAAQCRPAAESVVGAFYVAVGDRAVASGKPREAAEAYAAAASHYEDEKLPVPAQVSCAHGRAVLAEPGVAPQRLELAARLLHKCLLAAPPASAPHAEALAGLALLADRGLDPEVLARGALADSYLGGAAPPPSLDAVRLEVAISSKSRAGSLKRFEKFLARPEVLSALAPCWKAHNERTQESSLAVPVALRYGYDLDENDDFERSWIKLPDPATTGGAPLDEDAACARAALAPLAEAEGKKLGDEARWDATATFTLAPAEK